MLTQLGSPSRNSNPDRQSPVHLDGSGQGQEVLRSFDSPSPMASRPSIGSGGPGSARSQQKQRMQMGSPMHPNAGVLEPGGGLTNPGPGQFGRGPSPLEGRLGDVVSPPPRMEELSEMLAATQLNGGPPPMLMGGGGMRGRTSVQTQLFSQPDYVSGPMGGGQQGAGQLGANNWQRQMADMPPKGYKTVMCKFWENNMCAKGPACTFAHGQDDLQRFAVGGGAGGVAPSPLKLDRYKTKLCLFHMQGRCCKGPACPYAHGLEELRPAPLTLGGVNDSNDGEGQQAALSALLGGLGQGQRGFGGMEEVVGGLLGGSPYKQGPPPYSQGPPPPHHHHHDDDDIPLLGGTDSGDLGSGGAGEGLGGGAGMGRDELDSAQAAAAARYFQQQQEQEQHKSMLQQHGALGMQGLAALGGMQPGMGLGGVGGGVGGLSAEQQQTLVMQAQQQQQQQHHHHHHHHHQHHQLHHHQHHQLQRGLPLHARPQPVMPLPPHMPPHLSHQMMAAQQQKRGMGPGGKQGQGAPPPQHQAPNGYMPVSMWPHGPAWSGEEST